jgi:hypothetical protein
MNERKKERKKERKTSEIQTQPGLSKNITMSL